MERDYTMSPDERAELMQTEITKAVDRTVAAFACTEEQHEAIGDFTAAVLGRVMSLFAGYAVEVYELKARVSALEAREAGSGEAQ